MQSGNAIGQVTLGTVFRAACRMVWKQLRQ
jgi:hypothetical protein